VLDPLGMKDTRITLTPGMKARLAIGHDAEGARVGNWDFLSLPGAGALRSTARDLLRFVAANMDSNATPISQDLRAGHRPRLRAGGPNVQIGLAWHMLDNFGAVIHMHNGGTGGYRSFIGYDPAIQVGVVLLANASNDVDDLALHLLNPRYPIKQFEKHTEVHVDAARLTLLDGDYSLAPTFVLSVTHQGERLYVQATGQPKLQAFAESDTGFFFKAVEARVTFTRDASGRGTGIVLHQNGRSTPGKRLR
jgi:CubicO group peptidase (beta-lactamase class C family)